MKAGFDVDVYEQAPVLSEVGAGIQITANAMHVLNDLYLGPVIRETAVRPAAYVFRLHDTGEVIAQFSLAATHERLHKAPYNQIHRADLHAALAARARSFKPDVVHLNKRAVSYSETDDKVTLHLADGTSVTGDLLIGADGVESAVRAQMIGEDRPVYTGDVAWRLTVPTERLPKGFLEPVISVFIGPGAHVECYYLRGGALLNFVGLVETDEISEESWTAKFPWERLKADFAGWNATIQTVIDMADRDQCYRWSLFYRHPIDNWSSRRVTMLGDAVHATLPYLAQGAAMAIEDGAVLARALQMKNEVADALQLYQSNRIERTGRIVRGANGDRTLLHMRDQRKLREAFKNRDKGGECDAWLYSYNPLTVELGKRAS
jgi:salicylate hydroxylase